jgi:hypothetical protein
MRRGSVIASELSLVFITPGCGIGKSATESALKVKKFIALFYCADNHE